MRTYSVYANVDHFYVLRTTWIRREMRPILKIDFKTVTKIILASIKYGSHSTVALLNTKVYIAF